MKNKMYYNAKNRPIAFANWLISNYKYDYNTLYHYTWMPDIKDVGTTQELYEYWSELEFGEKFSREELISVSFNLKQLGYFINEIKYNQYNVLNSKYVIILKNLDFNKLKKFLESTQQLDTLC